ncbi:unnamed protein product [Closterium sp. NIES-53]
MRSHQTPLRHHRLSQPSLPRLRGTHSRLLVSVLPRSLPPLLSSPAPPCLLCVEGWQRAAPHSSSFPPRTAPLQTLHMDVWGPARVSGQDRECYFLLVVDDYTLRLQLCERFRQDLPVLRLHSDIGVEFSSNLLREFCRGEGILQSFMLPASPQQNGIANCRIGIVIEVARTSMIHAAALHFLWPFAVRYAVHQLNLWPRVSLPETSPTLRWTEKVGGASVFQVWGSRAFVRDTSADKLSSRAIPCVYLGFLPDAPGWQFYHPTSRRVLPSQDVTFDESVPFYRLFLYCSAPLPPPPLFLALGPPLVDPLPPQGPAPSGVSQVDPLPGCCGCGCGAEPEGAKPGGAESEGARSRGAEPRGTASSGGPAGASPRRSPRPEPLSSQQLREWYAQRTRLRSGAAGAGDSTTGGTGAGGAGATSLGGARTRGTRGAGAGGVGGAGAGGAGAGDPGAGGAGARGTRPGGTRTGGSGAGRAGARDPGAKGAGGGGSGAGGAGAGDTGAVDPGAGGACAGGATSGGTSAGGTVQRRPFFVPPPSSSLPPPDLVLLQVLSLPSSTGLPPSSLSPPPRQLQQQLQPDSRLPTPPYTEQTDSFTEHREPKPRPATSGAGGATSGA